MTPRLASPLWGLLKTFSWQELRHHPWQNAAAVAAVMLGVALAFAVQLINASALDELRAAHPQVQWELQRAIGEIDSVVDAMALAAAAMLHPAAA